MGNKQAKSPNGGRDLTDMERMEQDRTLKSLLQFQSHEFLVFGFMRMEIEPFLSAENPLFALGTPHELLQLIIAYYNVGVHAHLLLWCGSEERTSMAYNQVHILNIKNFKKYKLSIYDLDDANLNYATKSLYFDRVHSHYCSVSGVKLPRWVLDMETAKQHVSRHKKYHIAFRFGGDLKYDANNAAYQHRCDMLIIDASKLNAIDNRATIESYLCRIPTTLSGRYSEYPHDVEMCFNNNYLILCGGYKLATGHGGYNPQARRTPTDRIKRFDLQTLTWDDDKYIQRRMKEARFGVSACMMKAASSAHSDKAPEFGRLVTVGGMALNLTGHRMEPSNVVEMYSFDSNESVKMGSLRRGRYKPGVAYLPLAQQLICIGGETFKHNGGREIEVYDFHANKWNRLKKKCVHDHVIKPLVWNDEMNYNILYVAGRVCYNAKRLQLGELELIDMRMAENWSIVADHELISRLELKYTMSMDVFNDWTARRTLLI